MASTKFDDSTLADLGSPLFESDKKLDDDFAEKSAPSSFHEVEERTALEKKKGILFGAWMVFSSSTIDVLKYLNQSNISNAYVSGMKTDLALYGNQLNYFTTYFNIGYIVMLYPSILILSRFGPVPWLPSLEVLWGVLACGLSAVKNYKQVYVIRAFMGLMEGSCWPGWFTLLSAWYTPGELALRMGIYDSSQSLAGIFAGALQGALYTNLNGADGRSGWRWMFLINGLMTIFVGLLGYFCIPGFPDRPNKLAKWYMPESYLVVACRRIARLNRQHPKPLNVRSFFRQFLTWELWLMGIGCWVLGGLNYPSNYFNLWLESLTNSNGTLRYSVAQLNYIPMGANALAIAFTVALTRASDWSRTRLPWVLLNSFIGIFAAAIIAARPASLGLYYVGYFLMQVTGAGYLVLCAWISATCSPELRTVIFASGTCISYILSATVPLAAFPASQAPDWKIGAKLTVGTFAASVPLYLFVAWLDRRKFAKLALKPVLVESDGGEREVTA